MKQQHLCILSVLEVVLQLERQQLVQHRDEIIALASNNIGDGENLHYIANIHTTSQLASEHLQSQPNSVTDAGNKRPATRSWTSKHRR